MSKDESDYLQKVITIYADLYRSEITWGANPEFKTFGVHWFDILDMYQRFIDETRIVIQKTINKGKYPPRKKKEEQYSLADAMKILEDEE